MGSSAAVWRAWAASPLVRAEPMFRIVAKGEVGTRRRGLRRPDWRRKDGTAGPCRSCRGGRDMRARCVSSRPRSTRRRASEACASFWGTTRACVSAPLHGASIETAAGRVSPFRSPRCCSVPRARWRSSSATTGCETRRIKTGLSSGSMVEVRAGLSEGDLVVARSGTFLRDGDLVRPHTRADKLTRSGR